MNFRPRPKEEPEINLIPFIDVLLVILIFLMLTTTYSKFTELQVTLPVAQAEQLRERPREIVVAVSPAGLYAVNHHSLDGRGVEPLAQALADAARAGRPGQHRHHQRRRHGAAPGGDHRDGSGAPRRPGADHLRHAVHGRPVPLSPQP